MRHSHLQSRQYIVKSLADMIPRYFTNISHICKFMSVPELRTDDFEYIRVNGFRLSGNRIVDEEQIKKSLRAIVDAIGKSGIFGIESRYGKINIYIGCRLDRRDIVCSALSSNLDNFKYRYLSKSENHFENLPSMTTVQGTLLGQFNWEAFCRSLRSVDGFIGIIIKQIDDEAVNSQLKGIADLESLLSSYKYKAGLGMSGVSQRNDNPNTFVINAMSFVDFYKKQLSEMRSDKVYFTSVCCFAENHQNADKIASKLCGAFLPDENSLKFVRPLNTVDLDKSFFEFSEYYLPCLKEFNEQIELKLPLFANSLCSVQSLTTLSKLLPLPMDEFPGYYIEKGTRTGDSYDEFDLKPHSSVSSTGTVIGTIEKTGEKEILNLNNLREHCLIVGSSGSGKSTTIKNLAKSANDLGVVMTFFEPIKNEFSSLPALGVPSKIYSSGHSGNKLSFNPFIPEELTNIRDHIRQMVVAITAASDNESPIPEALQMLMLHLYAHHGWKPDDIVFASDRRTFPNFKELYNEIQPYFNGTDLYSGEVRTNVKSALTVRLNAIKDFDFVNGENKLPTEHILSSNAIIQFDGLTHTADKCFLANILLTSFNEYIRSQDTSEQLKRLLIIDEAHNFFKRESHIASAKTSSLNEVSKFFSTLLAEVRSYGVGIIVSDQSPSCLDKSVIANTAIKIAHALEDAADIGEISSALGLSDYQKKLYHSLSPGEAIVSVRGSRNVVKVKIKMPDIKNQVFGMCRFCNCSNHCIQETALNFLNTLPSKYYAAALKRNIADKTKINDICNEVFKRCGAIKDDCKKCLLGMIVEQIEGMKYREYINSTINELLK